MEIILGVLTLLIVLVLWAGLRSKNSVDSANSYSPPRRSHPGGDLRITISVETDPSGSSQSARPPPAIQAALDRFERYPLAVNIKPIPQALWQPQSVQSLLSDNRYEIDLLKQTCTCQDFKEGRETQARDHFSRLCKHQVQALVRTDLFEFDDEYQQEIALSGHGGPIGAWWVRRQAASDALITLSRDGDWINVLARAAKKGERAHEASGRVKTYGWNVRQKRWASGEAPAGARELRQILSELG